jgi:hypothetical protein
MCLETFDSLCSTVHLACPSVDDCGCHHAAR